MPPPGRKVGPVQPEGATIVYHGEVAEERLSAYRVSRALLCNARQRTKTRTITPSGIAQAGEDPGTYDNDYDD